MDFIERIFGIALDGGTGSLELVLFALPFVLALAFASRRKARRR